MQKSALSCPWFKYGYTTELKLLWALCTLTTRLSPSFLSLAVWLSTATSWVALFPRPTQVFVACSTEKWGDILLLTQWLLNWGLIPRML